MHLKRMAAPAFWPIHRKEKFWTHKPRPGPFAQEASISLGVIIRDILGLTKAERETKILLNEQKVRVNGRACKDLNFPIGQMDVLEIVPTKIFYRVLPNKAGLYFKEVSKEETAQLLRITGKQPVAGKDGFQYSFTNGFVLVSDKKYSIGDTLKMADGKVVSHLPFAKGNFALITGGAKMGSVGRITSIMEGDATRTSRVQIESDGQLSETVKDYIFIIGKDKAEVEL